MKLILFSFVLCLTHQVLPLYIKAASVFYGRIVRKEDTGFQDMVAEMTSYYAGKKPGATEVLEGGLYAVQEEEDFHRSEKPRGWGSYSRTFSGSKRCIQDPHLL